MHDFSLFFLVWVSGAFYIFRGDCGYTLVSREESYSSSIFFLVYMFHDIIFSLLKFCTIPT